MDTSVWVDHFRQNDDQLHQLLNNCKVCIHPMVIGELACGHLKHRKKILSLINELPHVEQAKHDEVLFFIERNKLMGKGIGLIDLHLLCSTLLSPSTLLWTRDRRLNNVAVELKVNFLNH